MTDHIQEPIWIKNPIFLSYHSDIQDLRRYRRTTESSDDDSDDNSRKSESDSETVDQESSESIEYTLLESESESIEYTLLESESESSELGRLTPTKPIGIIPEPVMDDNLSATEDELDYKYDIDDSETISTDSSTSESESDSVEKSESTERGELPQIPTPCIFNYGKISQDHPVLIAFLKKVMSNDPIIFIRLVSIITMYMNMITLLDNQEAQPIDDKVYPRLKEDNVFDELLEYYFQRTERAIEHNLLPEEDILQGIIDAVDDLTHYVIREVNDTVVIDMAMTYFKHLNALTDQFTDMLNAIYGV